MASEDSTTQFWKSEPLPFLLIVRTPRIVTFFGKVPGDTRMFQHLARFGNGHWAVAPMLFTVIVTAAIDRGFGSGLITPPLDLPASGRRHPIYVPFRVCMELCFW
jgi:hypothetical protein